MCSAALLLLLALPAAAGAYTLVLRSGRRVTIPDAFTVTTSAIVYEPSPGFSATVWLSNVDVPATERANGETAGSFAGRSARPRAEGAGVPSALPSTATAKRVGGPRVITNQDLEPSRRKRAAQDEEYERTRRERGLPSKEELQRQVEEQDIRLRELLAELEAARKESEMLALRAELSAVRSNLSALNSQLSQAQAAFGAPALAANAGYYPYVYTPGVQIIGAVPFGFRGRFPHRNFRPPLHSFGRRFNPRAGWPRPLVNTVPPRGPGGFGRPRPR